MEWCSDFLTWLSKYFVNQQKLWNEKRNVLGGLGFREIEKFNQSLLAKQAWRIWSKLDSLVSRILKQRYFARSSFLESGMGSRPSFAWRSILFGRELMNQGLVHRVGDGRNIIVWIDNWIVDNLPRTPRYRQNGVVDLTLSVHDLINPITRQWDANKVREIIDEDDVQVVLQTKIHLTSTDRRVWCYTRWTI